MANRVIKAPFIQGRLASDPGSGTLDDNQIRISGLASPVGGLMNATTMTDTPSGLTYEGRMITMVSGSAKNEHRWVTGHDTGVLTLSDPFGDHWLRTENSLRTNMPFTQGTPVSGDRFILSWTLDEIISQNTGSSGTDAELTSDSNGSYVFRTGQRMLVVPNHIPNTDTSITEEERQDFTVRGVSVAAGGVSIRFTSSQHLYTQSVNPSFYDADGATTSLPNNVENIIKGYVVLGEFRIGDSTDMSSNGYSTNTVALFDAQSGSESEGFATFNGLGLPGNNISGLRKGAFHQYGGTRNQTGSSSFLRYYNNNTGERDANLDALSDFVQYETQVSGNFGSRISGDRSILIPSSVTGYNSSSDQGYSNPIRPGFIGGFTVRNSSNVIYNVFGLAGTTVVPGIDIQDIDAITNAAGAVTVPAQIISGVDASIDRTIEESLTLRNWSIEQLERETVTKANTRFYQGQSNNQMKSIIISKEIDLRIIDESSNALSAAANLAYTDVNEDADHTSDVISYDTATGSFPTSELQVKSWPLTAFGDISSYDDNIGDGGLTSEINTPYTYGVAARNRAYFHSTTNLRGPVGPLELSVAALPDLNITNTDTTVVDEYTELETPEKLYDYAHGVKFRNPRLPAIDDVYFERSGDTLTSTSNRSVMFSTAVANDGDPPFDFDPGAVSVIVGAGGYQGGIDVGSGNVTFNNTIRGFVNAATINNSFTDRDIIIDTEQSVSGTMALNTGTYFINNADISLLMIISGGGAVTVNVAGVDQSIINAANALSGADVTVQIAATTAVPVVLSVDSAEPRTGFLFWKELGTAGTGNLVPTVGATTAAADYDDIMPGTLSTDNTDYAIWYLPESIITSATDKDIYDFSYTIWNPSTDGNLRIRSFKPDPENVLTQGLGGLDGVDIQAGANLVLGAVEYLIQPDRVNNVVPTTLNLSHTQALAIHVLQSQAYIRSVVNANLTSEQRVVTLGIDQVTTYNRDANLVTFNFTPGQLRLAGAQGFTSTPVQGTVNIDSVISATVITPTATLQEVMDAANVDTSALETAVASIDMNVDSANVSLGNLTTNLTTVSGHTSRIESGLGIQPGASDNSITTILNNTADTATAVGTIEADVSGIDAKVDDVQSAVDDAASETDKSVANQATLARGIEDASLGIPTVVTTTP